MRRSPTELTCVSSRPGPRTTGIIESLESRVLMSVAPALVPWARPRIGVPPVEVPVDVGGGGGSPTVPSSLAGLTLVNADTDADLGPLADGQSIDLGQTGSRLNVRADPQSGVGSVKFELDGGTPAAFSKIEATPPLALFGDDAGNYSPWTPAAGAHTLVVTPYRGPDATGTAGPSLTVRFNVTPASVPAPTPTPVEPPPAGQPTPTFEERIAHALDFARQQLDRTLADFGGATTVYPQTTGSDGSWTRVPRSTWSSGLFPAALWQMFGQTGDAYWKDKAVPSTLGLRGNETLVEDSHFRVFAAFEPLYRATTDPAAKAEYRDILLKAAESKASTFNDTVGAYFTAWRKSSSGDPRANFGVLMDQMMDLELMFWASKQTGNRTYYDQAVRNAQTVASHLVRADGGSFQWGYFDRDTGAFVSGETAQGFSDDSTWSRGQAWGIHAFTMVYRETGDPQFLATAKKMADYYLRRLPADKVPFWDFDDPKVPETFKDSSAAAIAASGLVQLGELSGDTAYIQAAKDTLNALASAPYLAEGANSRAILNRGAWYVPPPIDSGESSMIWGDYYFLEAVNRVQAKA